MQTANDRKPMTSTESIPSDGAMDVAAETKRLFSLARYDEVARLHANDDQASEDALCGLLVSLARITCSAEALAQSDIADRLEGHLAAFVEALGQSGVSPANRVEPLLEAAEAYGTVTFDAWVNAGLFLGEDNEEGQISITDEILCAHDAGICRIICALACVVSRGHALTQDEAMRLDRLWDSVDGLNRYPLACEDMEKVIKRQPLDIIADTRIVRFTSTDDLLCHGSVDGLVEGSVMLSMSGRHALAQEVVVEAVSRRGDHPMGALYATLLSRVREVRDLSTTSRFQDVIAPLSHFIATNTEKNVNERWADLTRFGSFADHLLAGVCDHLNWALADTRLDGALKAQALSQLRDAEMTCAQMNALVARGLQDILPLGPTLDNCRDYRAWKRAFERVPAYLRDERWETTWNMLRRGYNAQAEATRLATKDICERIEQLQRLIAEQDPSCVSLHEEQELEDALIDARFELLAVAAPYDAASWDELR